MKHLFMNKGLPLLALALTLARPVAAQTAILYQEDFGTTNGGGSLAAVGWSQVVPTGGYSGFYSQSGAIDGTTAQSLPTSTLYFGGNSGTGIFFTTSGSGSGTGGDSAFTSINPALYTNLNISVESQWSYQGANLNCCFAVLVGGAWYIDTNAPLTTAQHSANAIFYQSSITYNPAATNWNVLTNTSVVGIGPKATSSLSGTIDGIGIVAALSGSGSWNFNNYLITSISNPAVQIPLLTAAPISQTVYAGGGVSFTVGATGSSPLTYIWQDNGVTLTNNSRISGANTATITIENANALDAGTYSVIVSNAAGSFNSSTNTTTTLTVNSLPPDYLYAATFPFVGPEPVNYPLSTVGWSNSIPDSPYRLFANSDGDGAFYAYEGSAATTAFYVNTSSGTGASGLPFLALNPSTYPAVAFSVDVAPTYQPGNVTAYFAVQMGGNNWYAMSTPIPVNTSAATGTYSTYAMQFSPLAGDWNTLSLSPTGAVIGASAGSNLTGNITGAGVVVVFAGTGGNFNFDNFLFTTDSVSAVAPTITASPLSQTVYAGAGVSFAGTATGSQPLTYYWLSNSLPVINGPGVSGANSNVLTILNVNSNSAGQYTLIASNSAGTDSSANYVTTVLTVNDLPTNLLYDESFPFVGPVVGNYPLSVVGWVTAAPDAPTRLFQVAAGTGAFYNYETSAGTTAYYATTASDPGTSGLPFPSINIAASSGLTFSASIAPTTQPTNLTASTAVQINGTTWYVSATSLPLDTSVASATYSTVTQAFSPAAANWDNLTISGTGAVVGGPAAANLSGNITGAGLVFNFTGPGSFNVNDFQITGTTTAVVPANTLTANPASAVGTNGTGATVALDTVVTSPGATVNEGTVTFNVTNSSGAQVASVTSGTVSGGNASGLLSIAALPSGIYKVSATYNPASSNPNFNASSSAGTGTLTVVAVNPGRLVIGPVSGANVTLSWTANPTVEVESTTNLNSPIVWSIVPGTLGQGSASIPRNGKQTFVRLVSQ